MVQFADVILWNACLAGILSVSVFAAQQFQFVRNRPHVCHALWLLVLFKLLTPPLFSYLVIFDSIVREEPRGTLVSENSTDTADLDASLKARMQTEATKLRWVQVLFSVSAVGSFVFLLSTLSRVRFIHRWVRCALNADQWLQELTRVLALELGSRRIPSVRVHGGKVSPFLWAGSADPLIVLPEGLIRVVEPEGIRLIIQHELAHYARRDHWTNTFTMIVVILFWWNPVVWWARRELSFHQECCCDAMVLEKRNDQRVRYAETLLKTVDFIAMEYQAGYSAAIEFGSRMTFRRRVENIVSKEPIARTSNCSRSFVLACCLLILPGGLTNIRKSEVSRDLQITSITELENRLLYANSLLRSIQRRDKGPSKTDRIRERAEQRIRELKEQMLHGEMSYTVGMRLVVDAAEDVVARKKRYSQIEREFDVAVRDGLLSREEAGKLRIAARNDIFRD